MNNTITSTWDVILYLRKSAHRYFVEAIDESAALKAALEEHNIERGRPLTIERLADFTVTRMISKEAPAQQAPIKWGNPPIDK